MDLQRPVQTVDLWDVRLRASTVRFAVWITIVVCSVAAVYLFSTWDQPNRPLILGLLAAAGCTAIAAGMLDAERIVRSRWREHFFIGWSILDIAFVAVIETLDGGARSPVTLIYFLPLVFAALSYPLPSVIVIAAVDLGTATAVGALVDGTDFNYPWF